MKYLAMMVAIASLAACENMDSQSRTTAGALGGGAVGVGTAKALGGGTTAQVIGGLAGAAGGVAVAQNQQTAGRCYATRADGSTYEIACP